MKDSMTVSHSSVIMISIFLAFSCLASQP